jgi:hypothetical protein
VYDLSTVKPHVPERRAYNRAEWPIYCEGYYQALCVALRVIGLAAARWEAVAVEREKPRLVSPSAPPERKQLAAPAPASSAWPWWYYTGIVLVALIVLEVLGIGAALIVRLVR